MANFTLPIKAIGENNWEIKLRKYLEEHEVECIGTKTDTILGTEQRLALTLPEDLKKYYLHFGEIESLDFMYSLKKVNEFEYLTAVNLDFINLYFENSEIHNFIVFSESPGNDPLCFDKLSGEIYLFSHDPVMKAKVFQDFNQYVLHEIIEAEKLLGDFDVEGEDEFIFKKHLLSGSNINYSLRNIKL